MLFFTNKRSLVKKLSLLFIALILIYSCSPDKKQEEVSLNEYLKIAAQSVINEFNHPSQSSFKEIQYDQTRQGVCVRFFSDEGDRACISFYDHVANIPEAISTAAVNAAFFDGRYPPLNQEELDQITIEICIYSEFKEIESISKIKLGIDSVLVRQRNRQALIQAPLAQEYGWTREDFVAAVCRKAGMENNTYLEEDCTILTAKTSYLSTAFLEALEN